MSKGLEALKRITLKDFILNDDSSLNDIKIIKKELKEYEMEHTLRIRLENINYELVREKQENEKKLKALEIIKIKKIDVYQLLENSINAEEYNHWYCYEKITKKEFDLLKEVLL